MLSDIQKEKIKLSLFSTPYVFLYFLWVFLFFLINVFLNDILVTIASLIHFKLYFAFFYGFFYVLNALLIGLSINLIILKYKEIKFVSAKSSLFSVVGTFLAFLTGACPGCVAGFFPVFMGLFGASLSLNDLPFYGIEIQAVSLILLLLGIFYLSKDLSCKINLKKNKVNSK